MQTVPRQLQDVRLRDASMPRLHHWREARGLEVDLVVDDGSVIWLVEKSGRTVARDWFAGLRKAAEATAAEPPT